MARLRRDFFQRKEITIQNTLYSHYAVINRIIKRMQKVFKSWKLRTRINSLANIAKYAAAIDSPVLYLEQSMYLNLKKMREAANGIAPKQVQ